MSKSNKSAKSSVVKSAPVSAPVLPDTTSLPITDPKRRLTREEWKTMTPEQKAERKLARKATRGPVRDRFVKGIARTAGRFAKLAKRFEGTALHVQFIDAEKVLRNLAGDVSELPDGWTPSGKGPRFSLEAGTIVVLVESKLATYKDVLGDDETLTVKKVVGKRVVVETADGVKLFLPTGHVKPAPTVEG